MPGWGNFFGAIGNLIPSRKEMKLNEIEKLIKENERLANEKDFDFMRFNRNADRIKQLRQEADRIA